MRRPPSSPAARCCMLTQVGTGFAASARGELGAKCGEDRPGLIPGPPPAATARGENAHALGEPLLAPPRGELMHGEPMREEPMRGELTRGRLGELRAGSADRRSRSPGPRGDPPTCGGCQEHMPVKTDEPGCP
mmetsp:Transcript_114944/g.223302  ORF Transcript_114944/g.223302 Transcript_114944/m.223302 type:complete len:133 (+) Transcript_114944:1319-1717(+)